MTEGLENIGKQSVIWSYAAVLFTVGGGVILLPFILHYLKPETVAIWNILQTISMLTLLLDFGLKPSFERNVSFIFSGVKKLQVEGVGTEQGIDIDYGLLKGTIVAMRRIYGRMAIAVFLLLSVIGTSYFIFLMKKYHGDQTDAVIAWVIFCVINCYNFFTFYYDSLLMGKGYVEKLQQITILGQSVYLLTAISFLVLGFGLVAVVSAQTLSCLIRRRMAYKVFYSKELKCKLDSSSENDPNEILRIMKPNTLKVGITQLSGFAINKAPLFFGSVYLSLDDVAMYGISVQVLDILARCGTILFATYCPLIAQCRAKHDMERLKILFFRSIASLLLVYLIGGFSLLMYGNTFLDIMGSQTHLLPILLLLLLMIVSLLEQNHSIAAGFIQADNRIPFCIPSMISCGCTIFMTWLFLDMMNIGIIGLILAPGIVQLAYQNWKWPCMMLRELHIAES